MERENEEHIVIPPEVPAAPLLPWLQALHFIVISSTTSEWQLSCAFSLQVAGFELLLNLSLGFNLKNNQNRRTLLHFIILKKLQPSLRLRRTWIIII